jgi:hypothetical protein
MKNDDTRDHQPCQAPICGPDTGGFCVTIECAADR